VKGKIPTKAISPGIGTGFSMWLPSSKASQSYLAANLFVDKAHSQLEITTTQGLFYTTSNSQQNAIGVGIDLPDGVFIINTVMNAPFPAVANKNEQAGLFFGIDEDNVVKFVWLSPSSGSPKLQFLFEVRLRP